MYTLSLREKCPDMEFFSGPYFPAFGLNTEYLPVFSPNAGKYGPEKTPPLDTFHAVSSELGVTGSSFMLS